MVLENLNLNKTLFRKTNISKNRLRENQYFDISSCGPGKWENPKP
jgi:hypothetical protein